MRESVFNVALRNSLMTFDDSSSIMIKKFIFKALFILKILQCLLFKCVNVYDVTAWLTNNYNAHSQMSHEVKAFEIETR